MYVLSTFCFPVKIREFTISNDDKYTIRLWFQNIMHVWFQCDFFSLFNWDFQIQKVFQTSYVLSSLLKAQIYAYKNVLSCFNKIWQLHDNNIQIRTHVQATYIYYCMCTHTQTRTHLHILVHNNPFCKSSLLLYVECQKSKRYQNKKDSREHIFSWFVFNESIDYISLSHSHHYFGASDLTIKSYIFFFWWKKNISNLSLLTKQILFII